MVDSERLVAIMMESVAEAKNSKPENDDPHPLVGAILIDEEGKILAQSHRGEVGHGDHAEFILLNKAKEAGINLTKTTLFTTLEPCIKRSKEKTPCQKRIQDSGIPRVYIGMLDHNPEIRGRGEILLREEGIIVERYPDEIIRLIVELNRPTIELHKDSILPTDSIFVSKKISEYICEYMQKAGVPVRELPDHWDMTAADLERYCEAEADGKSMDFGQALRDALGVAYDKKYSDYVYDDDARGLNAYWREEIADIFASLRISDPFSLRMLNVGVGNGLELDGFFEDVADLTLVDIAPESLDKAKSKLERAEAICAAAEDLNDIPSSSFDAYISLRTYQSSYFGITRAARESYRVVRPGGIVAISISNGFIGKSGILVPGQVIPGTNIVDRNRPFEVADRVRRSLSLLPLDDVGIRTGFAEIFIFGRKVR